MPRVKQPVSKEDDQRQMPSAPMSLLSSARHTLALLAIAAMAGCAGAGAVPASGSPASLQSAGHRAAADSATGLPGESATGLPGESATGLPGESATGLPGANFSCAGLPQPGNADCTIAINVNIAPTANPAQPASLIAGLHPADLQSAYGLPARGASGTVAIVDAYDDPLAESDLATYRLAFGLPACTTANGCFTKLNQRGVKGSYPAANSAWSEEIALDLDMVSAACPSCSIVLVEADSALLDNLGAAVDTAVAAHATAVSNSYYAIEWSSESGEDVHYRHSGVAMTASSGDRGYATYPAASQYVTAVGGSSLARKGSGWSESPWEYTGHGCSAYIARPAWQHGTSCGTRAAVDLAAVADPATGVATYATQAGGWVVAGGTSVGAPLIAAAYVLSGRPESPSFSYARPFAFLPIGGSGYQSITGLGAPSGIEGL
jgi:subtilase family serine protease